MNNKKYIIITTIALLIFISLSTKSGTSGKYFKHTLTKKPIDTALYYENYKLVLIKYFY